MEIKRPKIVASSKSNTTPAKKKPFVKREKQFDNKEQMQAYLADSVAKNNRLKFNMKVDIGSKSI